MPRQLRPWFRVNRGWYVTMNGQQIALGITDPQDEAAAFEALKKLLSGAGRKVPKLAGPTTDEFLAKRKIRKSTAVVYRQNVRHFLARVGREKDLNTMTAEDIEATAKPEWSNSMTHSYLGMIGVLFRFAKIDLDRPIKRPPKESRGADAVWTDEEYFRVLGAARGDFRAVIQLLWLTGARPSEIVGLTADAIDWDRNQAKLKTHKNSSKGKGRTIQFPDAAMKILRAQLARHKDGPLFRQGSGVRHPEKPLDRKCLVQRMHNARKRAGVTRPLCCYGLRHTFITRALERGFSSEQVAALVGNSAAVIEKHYSHVGRNRELMAKMAELIAA